MAKTPYDKSYWCKTGRYQAAANALEVLVPDEGEAKTKAGEMFRLMVNVYYEFFNNGGSFTGGQRADDGRALKRLVKFATPHGKEDYKGMEAMADAVIVAAFAKLAEEPAALQKVLKALNSNPKEA